ncbi:hypothetical protein Tco_0821770 [Tanacetum coccineum]|uniref:Uncharacterized protein n=1 Tax=Tanacetum coccineum TaxID=301880 RepID=A0ABQ5AHE6_9ASTR
MDVELLDLHDRCYARQTVVDNAVNRRSRQRVGSTECESLRLRRKCEDRCMTEFGEETHCSGKDNKVKKEQKQAKTDKK